MKQSFQIENHKHHKKRHNVLSNVKLDSGILFQIKKYLRKEHQIPFEQIKLEYAIRITRKSCKILGQLNHEEISQVRGIIHTPDIIVTDKGGKPLFVIEQDGRIHESEERMKKDKVRNNHYAYAGIPCIVLNTKKIGAEQMIPGAYLDKKMEEVGMTKPVGLNPKFFQAITKQPDRYNIESYQRRAARFDRASTS